MGVVFAASPTRNYQHFVHQAEFLKETKIVVSYFRIDTFFTS